MPAEPGGGGTSSGGGPGLGPGRGHLELFALAERRGRIRTERAEQEAIAANERTERTFAQSLARPLDPNGDELYDEGVLRPLSEPEIGAFWELSLQQDKPIGLRFLHEAAPIHSACARSEPDPRRR